MTLTRTRLFFVCLVLVLAPALWNGFPLIFPDTGGYLARPIEHTLELGRSALYGAFLLIGVPFDFWPNIAVQAALTVWLILLLLRAEGFGGRALIGLAVVAVLTIATALPWYAATLMPDILLPAAVLSIYLLAFRRDALSNIEGIGLMAVIALAIASHMGTLVLCLGLLAALALARVLPRAVPRGRLTLAKIAVLAGLLLAPLSNLAITGHFAFTPGGETFLFGRLVQDGIVARYLADRCPDPSIKLCAFKDRMPASADEWLWAPANPQGELGGWEAFQPEARRIILDTLRMYPAMHVVTAARSTAQQFVMMKTEVSINPGYNAPALESLNEMVPHIMPRLKAARQQAAPFDLGALNVLHVTVAALSILGLIGLSIFTRERALALVVLLALIGNAAICGIFSNPVDRYQSRLVWLAPLALMVALLARSKARSKAKSKARSKPNETRA